MLVSILTILHHATTLAFGIFVSGGFLNIKMTRKNLLAFFGLFSFLGIACVVVYGIADEKTTEQLYPLMVHVPLILFFTFFYKIKFVLSTLSVFSAYILCQISNWLGIAAVSVFRQEWVYYAFRIIITVVGFFIIMKFAFNVSKMWVLKPVKALVIMSLIPIVYYVYDYIVTVYSIFEITASDLVAEFLGFVLAFTYIIFLVLYFKQYEEICESERQKKFIELSHSYTDKEIQAYKSMEKEIAILRHDMRHFLQGVVSFIEKGDIDRAKSYIGEVITIVDSTKPNKYCTNDAVNMILTYNDRLFSENDVEFVCNVKIPKQLPCSDVEITSILSNAFENAFNATKPLEPIKRKIEFDMVMSSGKLLISMKNTFVNMPEFVDGIPKSSKSFHGFGTQSINSCVEKLRGQCRFSVSGDKFVLQIII